MCYSTKKDRKPTAAETSIVINETASVSSTGNEKNVAKKKKREQPKVAARIPAILLSHIAPSFMPSQLSALILRQPRHQQLIQNFNVYCTRHRVQYTLKFKLGSS